MKMKGFFQSVLIALAFLVFSLASVEKVHAQENFGHVNTQEILQDMSEVQEAEREMMEYQQQLEQQLEALSEEFQRKMQEYQQQMDRMTQTARQDKERELQQLQERVENFQMDAQQEIAEKEQELLEPILEQVENAIQRVADEHGYTYVFDSSAGGILHAPDGDDISHLVRQELDVN